MSIVTQYVLCKHRGHVSNGIYLDGWTKCKYCTCHFVIEDNRILREKNIPKYPERSNLDLGFGSTSFKGLIIDIQSLEYRKQG